MNKLEQLHAEIETRVQGINAENADWLCRMGCDGCCHRLAEIPRLTRAEWELLREGLMTLPPEIVSEIQQAIAAWTVQTTRPLTCPMLNVALGACRVYAYRPVACRTYGFYVQRDKGLYCQAIEARVVQGDWSNVIWGNHDNIDRQLNTLGDSRDLTEWFALWDSSHTF